MRSHFFAPLLCFTTLCCVSLPLSADESDFTLQTSENVRSLKLPADLEAQVVLKEPLVANPLYIHFDARGRMWLLEYRQYPWPAGLRLLSRDAVWRNRYEPPFAPPPPHAEDSPFRGRDRISIHEDTNGDGTFDKSKVFLHGLNFATAALPGRGGVYVMNPPYLLFYADRNKDDLPDDEEPQILLSGFGIEDSHSIANSLRWGPDGWIYATQGSTVSGSVVRHGEDNKPIPGEAPVHSLGQNLWRYHPERHQYEIFAEGGGNAFGVEIDSAGRVYSGHNGGDTRGFHYVQGGYYQKTFGKHGNLSNPYTYGYFPAMHHPKVKRFTHTFTIYESNELPDRYHGKLFGVNPVENYVIHSNVEPDGSSVKTTDIATIVEPGDGPRADWFTPVDIQTGPDGALYLADWFSTQSNHYRNHEGETNPDLGRVIRIQGKGQGRAERFDLESLSSDELIDGYLSHSNRWFRHQTLRILGDRKDKTLRDKLLALIRSNDKTSLEALWAFNLSCGLDRQTSKEFLKHPSESVRRWTVRLIGDTTDAVDDSNIEQIVALAGRENNVEVMSRIICTARRLPAAQATQMIAAVLDRDEFADDIHIPLSLWWAIEAVADEHEHILPLLEDENVWKAKWKPAGSSLWANLVKRYVTKGDQSSLLACAKVFNFAPASHRDELNQAFAAAVEGQRLPALPSELEAELAKSGGTFSTVLAIRRGDELKTKAAISELQNTAKELPTSDAIQIIGAIGDSRSLPDVAVPMLLAKLQSDEPNELQNSALVALQSYDDPAVATQLIERLSELSTAVRETAESTLASRKAWSDTLLNAIESGKLNASDVQTDTIARLRLHSDSKLQDRVEKLFPRLPMDDKQLANRMAKLMQVISEGQGQPLNGKDLFFTKASCGKCHELFSEGGQIGPNLTPYNRTKIRDMLLAIVRPSAEVREGYENHTAITSDGQVITGLKIESNARIVILRGVDGQSHSIATEDMEDLSMSKQSLMPSGLLDQLTDAEVRDLFAYLVSTTPPK